MSADTPSTDDYVSGTYLAPDTLEDRTYQTKLVTAACETDTLVALPTGTGKTTIAARIADQRLADHGGKCLLLAPTQALVTQHATFCRDIFTIPDDDIIVFTGDVAPDDRASQWDDASIVVATPQVIENDLLANRYGLTDVVYLVFDECHRGTGDYAYTYIAERYHGNAQYPLATGLSASPGSTRDEILDVCESLGLTNIEVVTADDPDLQAYLPDTEVSHRWVELPDQIAEARDLLIDVFTDRLKALKNEFEVLDSRRKDISFYELQAAHSQIQRLIENDDDKGYTAMSVHAEAMKLYHALKLIETQSIAATTAYFEKQAEAAAQPDASTAVERMMTDDRVQDARDILAAFDEPHPKLVKTKTAIAETLLDDGKIIVFTESRDTAATLVDFLADQPHVEPARFVGQTNRDGDPGMTHADQQETLDAFRDGAYNVLVATSVAEEGLDIPTVDRVIFFEPVGDPLRSIQRRGRTGREDPGSVIVLVTEDTRDEKQYWKAQSKEEKMREELAALDSMAPALTEELRAQQDALANRGSRTETADDPVVIADTRETKSSVVQTLDHLPDVHVELETLPIGDYVVSERTVVERKELHDFVDTLTGERDLFDQITDLTDEYDRQLLILEGGSGIEALYQQAAVSPEAIRGALASLAIDYNVSLLVTTDAEQTAKVLRTCATREQQENDTPVSAHGSKATASQTDQQEYIVSSVLNVGPVTARQLLDALGSVQAVFTADKDTLQDVEGVGEATANTIYEISRADYTPAVQQPHTTATIDNTDTDADTDADTDTD